MVARQSAQHARTVAINELRALVKPTNLRAPWLHSSTRWDPSASISSASGPCSQLLKTAFESNQDVDEAKVNLRHKIASALLLSLFVALACQSRAALRSPLRQVVFWAAVAYGFTVVVFTESSWEFHNGARSGWKREPIGSASVELDQVSFAYEGVEDVDVLDGISLRIEPGDDVGFVGTTGSGKTTLIDLVLGLLDPTAGAVRIGDEPLDRCRSAWQRSIGYVPREIVLTDETIRADVAFGVPESDIDDDRVRESPRMAQIDEFVAALPAGLATIVGEDGVRLSGGQRRRLGLARALYGEPSVLVLDEATSALDSETEARVIDTVSGFHGKLTLISVAHRLSTLKHCDRIYFLAAGRVAAVGTFDELRALVPEFENLVTLGQVGVVPAVPSEMVAVRGASQGPRPDPPRDSAQGTARNGSGRRHLRQEERPGGRSR